MKKIQFTRACAASEDVLAVSATLTNAEIYTPDARVFQYSHKADLGENWYYEDFKLSVQDIEVVRGAQQNAYFALLSAEGDVYHFAEPQRYQERIEGAGTAAPDSRGYGKLLSMAEIDGVLFACGAGGQIYHRVNEEWKLLTEAFLFDPDAAVAHLDGGPDINDPEWTEWIINQAMTPATREIVFYGFAGTSANDMYFCGTERTTPILVHWDGGSVSEVSLPLSEGALTDVFVENTDSIWICGREGLLLHGNRHRGFVPVNSNAGLNLFHSFTPYRGKLVMPSSVRAGGLFELDPNTGQVTSFDPPLPRLTSRDDKESMEGGPFFAQATGNVLWVVATRDVFRFDGQSWERITHPDI